MDKRQDSLATQLAKLQSNLTESRSGYESSVAEAQTNLADAQHRIAELEKRLGNVENERAQARQASQKQAQTADRIARAQDLFKPGEATVLQDSSGHVIIRVQGLAFASGVTDLNKPQKKLLDKVKEAILQFPGASIAVEGHTDSQGNAAKLLELSDARAQSVAAYLTEIMKLKENAISAKGFGGTRPIAPSDTKENRALNRRIDIVLTLP